MNAELIKKEIDTFRQDSTIPYSEELAARLEYLQEDIVDDPEEPPISLTSIANFRTFIHTYDVNFPSLTLTNNSEIAATWGTRSSLYFFISFLDDEKIDYVCNKKRGDDEPDISIGTSTITNIINELPHPECRQLIFKTHA